MKPTNKKCVWQFEACKAIRWSLTLAHSCLLHWSPPTNKNMQKIPPPPSSVQFPVLPLQGCTIKAAIWAIGTTQWQSCVVHRGANHYSGRGRPSFFASSNLALFNFRFINAKTPILKAIKADILSLWCDLGCNSALEYMNLIYFKWEKCAPTNIMNYKKIVWTNCSRTFLK